MSRMLDAAIAVHPLTWREKYADVVRGTLMDVADDRGGRVPASETLPLVLRGLWMRARGSVAFWGSLVVLAIIVTGASIADPFSNDGSLTSHAFRLSYGLGYALPVLALLAGWDGARARASHIVGARSRLRRLWADSWPLLVVTAAGYLVGLGIVMIRLGVPWASPTAIPLIGAHAALVVSAIAIGYTLGGVLPRVLVIFAAPGAAVVLLFVPLMTVTPLVAAPLSYFYQGLAYVPQALPALAVIGVAAVLLILSIVVVAIRRVAIRAIPVLVVSAVVAGLGMSGAAAATAAQFEAVERPQSELVCSTDEPVVCLWPEQEAAFGPSLRQQMGEVYATAESLGLPVEDPAARSAAEFGMTGIPNTTENYQAEQFGLGVIGLTPDDLPNLYAMGIASDYWEAPTNGEGQLLALQYSIAILIGVPPEKAWPGVVDPYTGQRQFDPSGIPDEAAARALVDMWLSEGLNGVKAPS